jgi:hypothetical protein
MRKRRRRGRRPDPAPKLTWREVSSIRDQICTRLQRQGVDEVKTVCVGRKNVLSGAAGKLAVVYVVEKKLPKSHVPKSHRLGGKRGTYVYVGQGKRRRRLRLPTDVIEQPEVVPVGSKVTGAGDGTTCLIMRWKQGGSTGFGILTAAHVVGDNPDVTIPDGQGSFYASVRILYRARPEDKPPYDAALVEFSLADLRKVGGSSLGEDSPSLAVRAGVEFLRADNDGICHAGSRSVGVDLGHAYEEKAGVKGWPGLKHLLSYRSRETLVRPFRKGTSGSGVADKQLAPLALHVAARVSDYRVGYGHHLEHLLPYVARKAGIADLEVIGFC